MLERKPVQSDRTRIGGSIIQRTFIPSELGTVLNIATVPIAELSRSESNGEPEESLLRELTSEILGIPSSLIIDETQYQQLGRAVISRRLWDYPHEFSRRSRLAYELFELGRYREEFLRDLLRERMRSTESSLARFAEDAIALMVQPEASGIAFPYTWPLSPQNLRGRDLSEILGQSELLISTEAFRTGYACLLAGATAEVKVKEFTSSLQDYDIATGQSPKIESDSLLRMIETGKKMCLAPMVAGGTFAVSQLSQGALVASLLTVGAGAAATLILIGTLTVGDLLVRYAISKRPLTSINPPRKKRRRNLNA